MPLPETIDNWIPSEIRPHPGPEPIEVTLFHIDQEALEAETPTISSIQTEIKQMAEEGELPTDFQYFYWVLDCELSSTLDTGIICNDMVISNLSGNQNGKLYLDPKNLSSEQTLGVKIYFIFHPINYETTHAVTEWYIGFSKDDSTADLFAYLKGPGDIFPVYYYSSLNYKYTNIGLLPWTNTETETLYPQTNGLTLYASNRLPINNPY